MLLAESLDPPEANGECGMGMLGCERVETVVCHVKGRPPVGERWFVRDRRRFRISNAKTDPGRKDFAFPLWSLSWTHKRACDRHASLGR